MNPRPTPARPMPPLAALVLALANSAATAGAMAQTADSTTPTAQETHVADCVAALRRRSEVLAEGLRGGREELRAPLQRTLEQGAAFIGDGYLKGARDETRSKRLLEQQSQAQQALAPQALAALQERCGREADALLADANFVQLAVVRQFARRRFEKLMQTR